MTSPNIVATRIDERLVHGQGQMWIKALGVNTVIVANDAAAEDTMAQTLMKTVIPGNIAMRFFSIQKTIDIIHKAAPAQTIFLLVKSPADALRLVAGGVPTGEINVGNIHNADGKEKVTRSIFVGDEDKAAIVEMAEQYGIAFNTKTLPTGADGTVEVDLVEFCKR